MIVGNAIGASPILSLSANLKFTKIYDYSESASSGANYQTRYVRPKISNSIILSASPYIALITHFTSMTIRTMRNSQPGYVEIQSGALFNVATVDLCKITHNSTSATVIDLPYTELTFEYGKSFFDMAMNGLLYWPDFSYILGTYYASVYFTAEVLAVSLS